MVCALLLVQQGDMIVVTEGVGVNVIVVLQCLNE